MAWFKHGCRLGGEEIGELASPVNALPGSEEELWMAMHVLLLAMQRPPVLWFVTEITVSSGRPLGLHFWKAAGTVCQVALCQKSLMRRKILCAIWIVEKGGESRKRLHRILSLPSFSVLQFISCGPETVRINSH